MKEQANLNYINSLSGGDKSFEIKLISIIKKEFKIEKKVNQSLLTPLNKKLFESLRKKHNV